MEDYLDKNKHTWNQRTEVHVDSKFYDVKSFLEGKSSLNSIELELLGDLKGKSVLHLQCHFGMDSISLSKLGANVTGVDFSDKAIDFAVDLAQKSNTNTKFVCCDVYSLPQFLDEKFDIVFTSYGTIGWLPDLDRWAAIINHFLKPNGRFVFVEFHPMIWMFDNEFKYFQYSYFKTEPIIEINQQTYTNGKLNEMVEEVSWNHGLAEVFTSLISKGLIVNSFQEYDYSPYDCFSKTIEIENGKFRIEPLGDKIPMVYSLTASKVLG